LLIGNPPENQTLPADLANHASFVCSDDGVIENHKVLTYIEYRAVSEVLPPH
jgi:hypothetical protein